MNVTSWLAYLGFLLLCFGLWALLAVGCAHLLHASPADCEAIRDADHRHFCRAISKPDRLECELIHNADLRSECRARVP